VNYPLPIKDNGFRTKVTSRASVTDSRDVTVDFEESKVVQFSVPFNIHYKYNQFPGSGGSSQSIIRVVASSSTPIPLQIIRAVLLEKDNSDKIYAESVDTNVVPIEIYPQTNAHLTFIKTGRESSSPKHVVLHIEFSYNPVPNVQYRDIMAIPIVLDAPQPLFSVEIIPDGSEPLKICEPHNMIVSVRKNIMVSDDEAQQRLMDLRKNGVVQKCSGAEEESMIVGFYSAESSWQLLGLRNAVMSPIPISSGQEWQMTFTLIPLRTGYIQLPILRPLRMLASKDIFTTTRVSICVAPESTSLLTIKPSVINKSDKSLKSGSQRVIVHDETSFSSLSHPDENRKFSNVMSRADIVLCWFDANSLNGNPVGGNVSDSIKKMEAKGKKSSSQCYSKYRCISFMDKVCRFRKCAQYCCSRKAPYYCVM